jgi:hypothetical protein
LSFGCSSIFPAKQELLNSTRFEPVLGGSQSEGKIPSGYQSAYIIHLITGSQNVQLSGCFWYITAVLKNFIASLRTTTKFFVGSVMKTSHWFFKQPEATILGFWIYLIFSKEPELPIL